MICLTSVSYIVNVNGETTEPFEARKVIRQGDPISPYLFVICMEYLHRCLAGLHQNIDFRYHLRCKRLRLLHLCFADNFLLFTRGDGKSVQQVMAVLDKFAAASGLKANQLKSCIYFGGVHNEIKQEILQLFGMVEGQLPFRYLGVPLSSQRLTVMQC